MGRVDGQGRLRHRRRPAARAAATPIRLAAGGRRHHRGRPVRAGRHRPVPDGHAGGPGRDGQGGRGAGPADRRHPGRRTRPGGAQGRLDDGVAQLGGVDIVLGQRRHRRRWARQIEDRIAAWQDVVDVNLTGVWNTVEAAVPRLVEQGRGGAIVLTSSTAGLKGIGGDSGGGLGYTASKHGVVGLMRAFATNLAQHNIRVNIGAPDRREHADGRQRGDAAVPASRTRRWPARMDEPAAGRSWSSRVDISNAILWLVSDEARYVTGVTLPIDAGSSSSRRWSAVGRVDEVRLQRRDRLPIT